MYVVLVPLGHVRRVGTRSLCRPHTYYIFRNRNRASERRKAQNVLGVEISYEKSNDDDEAAQANAARLALVDSLHAHIGDVCPTPSAGHVICVQHAKQNALP